MQIEDDSIQYLESGRGDDWFIVLLIDCKDNGIKSG